MEKIYVIVQWYICIFPYKNSDRRYKSVLNQVIYEKHVRNALLTWNGTYTNLILNAVRKQTTCIPTNEFVIQWRDFKHYANTTHKFISSLINAPVYETTKHRLQVVCYKYLVILSLDQAYVRETSRIINVV